MKTHLLILSFGFITIASPCYALPSITGTVNTILDLLFPPTVSPPPVTPPVSPPIIAAVPPSSPSVPVQDITLPSVPLNSGERVKTTLNGDIVVQADGSVRLLSTPPTQWGYPLFQKTN